MWLRKWVGLHRFISSCKATALLQRTHSADKQLPVAPQAKLSRSQLLSPPHWLWFWSVGLCDSCHLYLGPSLDLCPCCCIDGAGPWLFLRRQPWKLRDRFELGSGTRRIHDQERWSCWEGPDRGSLLEESWTWLNKNLAENGSRFWEVKWLFRLHCDCCFHDLCSCILAEDWCCDSSITMFLKVIW